MPGVNGLGRWGQKWTPNPFLIFFVDVTFDSFLIHCQFRSVIVQFLGSSILKFRLNFWICVSPPICVGFSFSKSPCVYLIILVILYLKWGVQIWFLLNQRNFNQRNFQFLVYFDSKSFFLWRTLLPVCALTTMISKDVECYCASFNVWWDSDITPRFTKILEFLAKVLGHRVKRQK